MKDTIFFDLDGTLLQMDNDAFLRRYEEVIGNYFKSLGYNECEFVNHYNEGFYKMLMKKDEKLVEEAFLNHLALKYDLDKLNKDLISFFNSDFDNIKTCINKTATPRLLIDLLKERGYKLILATNPLFPRICTEGRIRWAGLDPSDFTYISTYENSHYTKPSSKYYLEIIEKNNLKPENIIMIGNDLYDDFTNLIDGMSGICITDYLINRHNKEYNVPYMTLDELYNKFKNEKKEDGQN